ncbi:MAG: lamin tail domain-containing protein [Acidobacteriota bacterium]
MRPRPIRLPIVLSLLCLASLLAGPALAGAGGAPTLLLSQVVVTPTGGELIEITNPTDRYIDLSDVYVTDATFNGDPAALYFNIVTGTAAGGGGFGDFHARFPDGASIAPGESQCIAIAGSDDYFTAYGELPTYELYEDGMAADGVPDMREALPGSINNQGGLTNSGEVVILYTWDGQSDLVQDLDYLLWGDRAEAVDKTGVAIDGPDGDMATSTYLADTATGSQDVVSSGAHSGGDAYVRTDFTEGNETLTGGNGLTGHDETSEDVSATWTDNTAADPQCDALVARLLLSEIVVEPTASEYIEIFNPTNATIDLSDVYLTDATFAGGSSFYYNIVTGSGAGGGGFSDFHARFPDGATIAPGEYQTISMAGSTDFFAEFSENPTYELYEDDGAPDATPDMREALAGSINNQGGLTNSGEVVILYHWNGVSDLVGDLDYAVWGDKDEAVDKTGVGVDGPDADGLPTTYLDDTAIASQDVLAAGSHGFGNAFVRVDVTEGTETDTGGNGVDADDETSEDLSNTWGVAAPTPNSGTLDGIALTIDDVELAEGDAGTTNFVFTVTLSQPAPAGGVTFDITTVDGTATVADSDYAAQTLLAQTIAAGGTEYVFTVEVNGDVASEQNETFTVEVSNVTPALVDPIDPVGDGTILNDDPVEIFTIQGSGAASSFDGTVVATESNVVTAVGPEGFFMQTPTARDDGDPATSNGIYVFTETPPAVAVGDLVDVNGTVVEFFDFTEINETTSITTGGTSPLPAPVVFDTFTPSPDPTMPSCPTGDLECFEGMLVTIVGGTVVQGNLSFGSDPNAEIAIVAKSERTFREPGVEFPGLGGSIPTWDGNPEIFELDPDKLGLPNDLISAGSTFSATGGIGFEFGDYELWPATLTVSPMTQPLPVGPVRAASADEISIGTLNFFRFFDDVDDPGVDDTVVSTAEYDCRRSKFVAYIDQSMQYPDILAVQEVDNLNVLQDLAADILTAGGPSYQAELIDGNDVGGIDVGYLVSNDFTIDAVTQMGAAETLSCDGSLLHDRPPLMLEATYNPTGLQLAVLVLHQRSLGGVDDPGETCDADPSSQRVRQKRLEQAQSVAQMVQTFQTNSPTVPLFVVGDFNGFEFTDGYVDVLGQIQGEVDPAQNLLSEPTITDPPLRNEVLGVPTNERYSFIFDGTSQILDHALSSEAARFLVTGFEFARGNADSPRILLDSCDAMTAPDELPLRASDHDGGVLYLLNDPGLVIFSDGFESGTLSAWSSMVP